MLFAEAATLYLSDKSRRLRASTLEGYESALRVHVLPEWGDAEIESIGYEAVQRWVDGFHLAGAAEKAYKTLRQVIRWAMRRLRVVMPDPTLGTELPRRPAPERRTLDAGQARAYLRAQWGGEAEAVAICALTLGLRRGEACGLRWEDIDLRTGEVRVRRSRQRLASGKVVEVAPKTERSARSCWLPRFAVRRLRQLRRGATGLLCALPPDAAARRLRSACRAAGAPWVSMTELRHSWATLAVEAGVGIETVAMMLGHTDVSTAYEHYIVPRASICRDAQREVERLIMAA